MGERQLVPRALEELLADDLRDPLGLGRRGQEVVRVGRLRPPAGSPRGPRRGARRSRPSSPRRARPRGKRAASTRSAIRGSRASFFSRSILFSARIAGVPALARSSRMKSSPGPRSSAASRTKRTRSAVDEGVGGVADHRRVHPVLGPVDAGRVDQRELRVRPAGDAEDALAGGLGLVGDDRDLFADEGVDQRGLAGVGPAHDRDFADFQGQPALSGRTSAGPRTPRCLVGGAVGGRQAGSRPARSGRGRRGAGRLPRP